jgi:hypothetical protein
MLVQREHFSAPRQSIDVAAGQVVTADFKLTVAAVHESLTVTASATGTATAFESFNAVTILDSFDILKRVGLMIADVSRTSLISKRRSAPVPAPDHPRLDAIASSSCRTA